MSKVLVVNPNTSGEMTAQIAETAEEVSSKDTKIETIKPERGPKSLESFYEYHLAAVAMVEAVEPIVDEYDGVVVSCYGDPGLYPLKEILDIPVVGIAESSLATATLLGHKFSILAAMERAIPMMELLVQQYGFNDRMASVEATDLSVLELESAEEKTINRLTKSGQTAKEKGAEVLILGCSGMTGYEDEVSNELDIPVINPVEDAITKVEGLIEQDLAQSGDGLWAEPPTKESQGTLPGDGYLD